MNPALETLLVDLDALHEDPDNARQHDNRNISAIVDSLRTFGQQKPIVIDRSGCILAGNGTFAAAKHLGWSHVAAVPSDLDSEEARRAYSIADNRTAELADWNFAALSASLAQLPEDLRGLVGFAPDELDVFMRAEWNPGQPDPDDDTLAHAGGNTKHTITLTAEAAASFAMAKASMLDTEDDSAAIVRLCRMWEQGSEDET